jgi:hypothetical protein
MTPTISHVSETISPELAQKYLDRNKLNRPVKLYHVKQLSADMKAHNFPENGENGVTFDWNGNIAGGQHTLLAVVDSGATITVRVTRGVPPEVRHTMNDSLKQRFADDLSVAGVGKASDSETLLRKVLTWEQVARENKGQGGLNSWRGSKPSRAFLASEWPTYATGIVNATNASQQWHRVWPGNRGAMTMMLWILREKYGFPEDVVNDFFSRVVYGSQDAEDRTLFLKLWDKFDHSDAAPAQVFWLIRVWNAWIGGENLQKLQEPKGGITDPYPKVRRPR